MTGRRGCESLRDTHRSAVGSGVRGLRWGGGGGGGLLRRRARGADAIDAIFDAATDSVAGAGDRVGSADRTGERGGGPAFDDGAEVERGLAEHGFEAPLVDIVRAPASEVVADKIDVHELETAVAEVDQTADVGGFAGVVGVVEHRLAGDKGADLDAEPAADELVTLPGLE